MIELDAIIAERLRDQPPVSAPPLARIRRQADVRARRRNALSAVCLVSAAVAAVAVLQNVGSGAGGDAVLVGPPSEAVVPAGATAVEVCPEAPPIPGEEQLCGSTSDPELVSQLIRLVNAAAAPADAQGCQPGDEHLHNVAVRFTYADGEDAVVRVADCIMTSAVGSDGPTAYAPEVARTAARLMRPAPQRSAKQGCQAVVEDVEGLLAQTRQSDVAYAVQMAEATIAEQRERLTPAQSDIVDDIKSAVTSFLYDNPDRRALEQRLADLRSNCP